jgi:membrane protein DedA with SNARE-associated domain
MTLAHACCSIGVLHPRSNEAVADWVTKVVEDLSYWGVALLMVLENIFPPLPSEVVLPAAGFAARVGDLSLWAPRGG